MSEESSRQSESLPLPLEVASGPDSGPGFEDAMAELEAIVAKLEDGSLTLDDAIQSFERGTVLVNRCNQLLKVAEQRIAQLTERAGELREEPLDPGEGE